MSNFTKFSKKNENGDKVSGKIAIIVGGYSLGVSIDNLKVYINDKEVLLSSGIHRDCGSGAILKCASIRRGTWDSTHYKGQEVVLRIEGMAESSRIAKV